MHHPAMVKRAGGIFVQKLSVQIHRVGIPLGHNGADRLAPALIGQYFLIDNIGPVFSGAIRLDFHQLLMQFRPRRHRRTQSQKELSTKARHSQNNQKTGYRKGIPAYFGHKKTSCFSKYKQNIYS